jgi:hypothetical protein
MVYPNGLGPQVNMSNKNDLWYRIGFALETAKRRLPEAQATAGKLLKHTGKKPKKGKPAPLDEATQKLLDAVLTVGAGTVLTRFLGFWPGRGRPGLFGLGRAGAAGAGAAFLAELLRPVLAGEKPANPDADDLTDVLLSGVGRGLVYAAIIEPRLPGPFYLRGSAYGALEWALTPWGGLEELAGPAAPHRKIPVLSTLLQGRKEEEELLEHLAFGIALALLYEK